MTKQISYDVIKENIKRCIDFKNNKIFEHGYDAVSKVVVAKLADSNRYIAIDTVGNITATELPSEATAVMEKNAEILINILTVRGFAGRVNTVYFVNAIEDAIEHFENYALDNLKEEIPQVTF